MWIRGGEGRKMSWEAGSDDRTARLSSSISAARASAPSARDRRRSLRSRPSASTQQPRVPSHVHLVPFTFGGCPRGRGTRPRRSGCSAGSMYVLSDAKLCGRRDATVPVSTGQIITARAKSGVRPSSAEVEGRGAPNRAFLGRLDVNGGPRDALVRLRTRGQFHPQPEVSREGETATRRPRERGQGGGLARNLLGRTKEV